MNRRTNQQGSLTETVEAAFLYYTQQAGALNRQLGFAAIAVIWLLRAQDSVAIREEFQLPLILIVTSLAVDILQYLVGSALWWNLFKNNEGTKSILEFPDKLLVIVVLLGIKLSLMMVALVVLLVKLSSVVL